MNKLVVINVVTGPISGKLKGLPDNDVVLMLPDNVDVVEVNETMRLGIVPVYERCG